MTQKVAHPFVPDWHGDRAWSAPGQPLSAMVTFEAGCAGAPFKIDHQRDMIFDDDQLVQDYNFINYFFGDPAEPIVARHYLSDPHVSVVLPKLAADADLADARLAFPPDVLTYLQRRFGAVEVLVREGYREIWAATE